MLKRSLSLWLALSAFAGIAAGQPGPSLSFIDRWGEEASRFVEYDFARVRLTDPSFDVSGEQDTVDVTVFVTLGTDVATVTLTETGPRTGIFEGGVDLRLNAGPPAFSWALETAGTPTSFDTLQVETYGDLSDTAEVVPSILRLVDDAGLERTDFAAGEPVFVRLIDRHSDTPSPDVTTVTLTTSGGDSEVVILAETAVSGGEFKGSIRSRLAAGTPTPGDGILDTLAGETLSASHADVNGVSSSTATASFAGITLRFVDSRGVPTSTVLEGARVTLQAISASANLDYLVVEQINATLTSQLGGDSETVILVETGTSTGVFEGRMRVTSYTPVVPGNYDIQVSPSSPVPDTIQASFPGAAPVTIHPSGSSTRLLDVWGNDAESFPRGGTIKVRVEDPSKDSPYNGLQRSAVQIQSLTTGDSEYLTLDETGVGSNVYEGTISLETGSAVAWDGKLQAQGEGEVLEARYFDVNGVATSTDTGRLSLAGMWFLDGDGRPTETVLENGTLRLRLFDSFRSSPGAADVTSEVAGDGENLFFSAVPDSPGSFEGSMPIEHMTWGTPTGNDILSTRYDDNSLDGLDTISAFASGISASARAAFSEIHFVDSHGNEADSFALGEALHVRLRSGAPGTPGVDQIQIPLLSQTTGDSETMTLTETGAETNVYQGFFPTGTGTASPGDGRLQVQTGETVAVEDNRADGSVAFVLDTAFITATRVTFVDRQHAPTDVVFRQGRARFEAFDLAANTDSNVIDTRSVTVLSYAESNGRLVDLETLDLVETGPNTSLFRGSIRLSHNIGSIFGMLDTSFNLPNEGPDRLRVEILGGSSDTAELTDAVVRFLDGQGNDASIYQAGDPVRIRLIREASNVSPVMVDTVSVVLSSWLGRSATSQSYDGLTLDLTETGADTGVFEGEIEATAAPVDFTDSVFQVQPGGEIGVAMVGNWTEDADLALIADGGVTPENNPPMAGDDSATVDEASSVEINVLANDTDPDGDTLSIVSFSQGTKGSVSSSGSGLLYTPNPNASGADFFTYTIEDPSGATDTGTVSVTLLPINDPPVAVADNITLNEDTPQGFLLLTNDFDPDGDALTITSATNGSHGSTIRFSTSVFYSPAANWFGTDSFTYTVSDGKGGTATATVFVTVNPVNDVPVAGNDSAVATEDTPITVNVLANDSDVDGDPLTITSRTNGTKGTVTINAGATVTYTPNLNATGADSFTYTVSDGKGGTRTATVTMTIFAVNDAPNAVNDSRTTPEDMAINIAILANDSDPEGQTLTVTAVTQGASGSVVLNADKTVTYTPSLDFIGSDSFTYTVSDGSLTATANVSVTMTAVNDPPYAVEDEITLAEDGTISFYVLSNDSDPEGDTIYVSSVLPAKNGVVSGPGLNYVLTYTPKPNFHGQDFFVYTVKDTNFGTNSATVLITVTPVDDPPTAVNDAATVAEDAPATAVNVLANDTDPDAGPISITSVTQPANGTVVITGGGTGLTYQPSANFCTPGAPDTFTYTLSPGGSTAAVSMTVTCADDNPVAVVDTATVAEDSGTNAINVLANDADPDGGPISISSVTQPANGTVVITNGGADLAYTPNANFCGTPDTFTYTLAPGGSTAAVSVSVTCLNDAPVLDPDANDDQGTAGNDFAVTFTEGDTARLIEDPLDATVTDVDSATLESLTVTITNLLDIESETLSADVAGTSITADYVLAPGTGVLTLTGPDTVANFQAVLRTVRYLNTDADPDATPRVIHFVANDGSADSNPAVSTVTLVPVDTEPVAVNDAATVSEDSGTNAIDVLANDTDPDGGPISITSVTQPANGTAVITGGGTGLTYTPNANSCTSETFTYTLSPGGSTATVSVTVTCVDDNPVAVNDAATASEDSGTNAIDVLANDTDADAGPISITSVTQPANGTAVITGGGAGLTYTPNANFCTPGAPETFTYTLAPGGSTATVSVTATCVDDNPVAVNDAASVSEDSGTNAIDVLANDTDADGGPISITSVTQPANGTVAITGGGTGLTYTPNANSCTSETFTYTLSPGGSTATVSVTVTCVDDNPVAVNDAATASEDSGTNAIDVLANDTDADAGPISITSVTQPANGTVAITGGGAGLTYTPNANFCTPGAPETFTYTLAPGGSTATVSVTVTCVDDNPVAVNDAATVSEDSGTNAIDVLANDTDVDGGSISITSVTQPANGTAVITGGGTGLTYTPNANSCTSETFTYTLSPGGSTATVSVTVTCVNDAPDAGNDSASTNEDSAVTVTVLGNDTDTDGDALTVSAVTQGTKGAVTINGGGTITYTPNANANGADSFTYTVSDGNGGSDTATVSVTINVVNDPPVAASDSASTNEDTAILITVLANDSDLDGDALSVSAVTQGTKGGVTINANGTVTYTPNANVNGGDSFTYTVSDGTATDTATVSVTINGINDAPDAINDAAATVEDAAVIITVLANDTDADGEALQVTAVTQGIKGAVTINANGTVTYTPAPNTFGADAFTYTVRDGANVTDTATVTVSVAPVNDAPVAVADTATTREGAAVTITVLANDSDLEGNTLTVTSVTTPVGGSAAINFNSTVTYTANANFNGTDSFTYTLSDGQGGTASATVTVTVTDALERVAVLATHGVWIQTGADVLSGDVIVNQTGAAPFLDAGSSEISLAGTVTTPAGYDVQANRVNVASGATVAGDVFYNQITGTGTVLGDKTSPFTLPVFATLPAFLTATPGAADVSVGTNGTRTLAAGSYRDLIVGRKGTVTFTGGTYHFRNIQVDREAKLFFSAASTVRVQQKMSVLQTSTIKPATGATIDGSDIVFHIAGANGTTGTLAATPKTVEIGVDGVVWANVYAPNGTIWMKDRTQVRGVLLGKDVQVGPNVQVTLDSSFTGQ